MLLDGVVVNTKKLFTLTVRVKFWPRTVPKVFQILGPYLDSN